MSSSPAGRDFAMLNLLSYGNTAKGGQATPQADKSRQSLNSGKKSTGDDIRQKIPGTVNAPQHIVFMNFLTHEDS